MSFDMQKSSSCNTGSSLSQPQSTARNLVATHACLKFTGPRGRTLHRWADLAQAYLVSSPVAHCARLAQRPSAYADHASA